MRTDGQKDRLTDLTKLMVPFCNYAKTPKTINTDSVKMRPEHSWAWYGVHKFSENLGSTSKL